MTPKKILFLGASPFQIAPIKYAKEVGHYVITCDNRPENPGHTFADEYHNVSTTDMESVLDLALRIGIDGIVAYASDPAAPTAAYVAEKLGLPGNPYDTVLTMTRKDLWRRFQRDNGFEHPEFILSGSQEKITGEVIIKPVDSSGSKGVSLISCDDEREKIELADKRAKAFSKCGIRIVEKIIPCDGPQIAGDGFVVNGKLVFRCFANEHFNPSGLVPIGESFPYIGNEILQRRAHDEIQRALDLLGFNDGALNFDIRVVGEKIYLMEIGPRAGGCLIPDVIKMATGVDLAACVVNAALGEKIHSSWIDSSVKGFWSSYMIHSKEDGIFDGLKCEMPAGAKLHHLNLHVKSGDPVKRLEGSHCIIGSAILEYSSQEQMLEMMKNMDDYIQVVLK